MSQCYIPSLHAIHFKGALNSGEAQVEFGVGQWFVLAEVHERGDSQRWGTGRRFFG